MAEHKAKVTELKGLEVDEVSHVDRPANLRPFLVVKSEGGINMPDLTEEQVQQLEDVLSAPAPGEDAQVAKAAGGGVKEALIRGYQRIRHALGAEAVQKLEASAAPAEPVEKAACAKCHGTVAKGSKFCPNCGEKMKGGDTADEEDDDAKEAEKGKATKALISKAVENAVSEVRKEYEGKLTVLTTSVEKLTKANDDLVTKADDAAVAEIVQKANLPGTSIEDQVKFVKSLTAEQREQWLASTTAAKAADTYAQLGQPIGTPRGVDASSAEGQIVAKAKALLDSGVKKADGRPMTLADAIIKVREDNLDLDRRYEAEMNGMEG